MRFSNGRIGTIQLRMGQKRKVLFVTYGGGHAKIIRALVQHLQSHEPEFEPHILALTMAYGILRDVDVPKYRFSDLVTPDDAEALKIGEAMAAGLDPNGEVPLSESIAYLGLSYSDLVSRHGRDTAAQLFSEQGRQAFVPLGPLRRLFDLVQPDLVVATNSPRAEQAAIMVARERGVPAVCIIDLFGGNDIPRARENDYADALCVLSETVKDTFASAGRNRDHIHGTGNPAFDSYGDPAITSEAAQLRRSKRWNDDKVVLWASQIEPSDMDLSRRVAAMLGEQFAARDVRVVWRPHPSEYVKPEMVPPGVELSTQSDPLVPLLKAVDVCCVISSTVGLEACLLGTPLVALDIPITMETAPYASSGMALGANSEAELPGVVEESLAGKRPSGAELPGVGSASARIADVMKSLVLTVKPS